MKEETRLRILKAAREIFSSSGWVGASTREIAERAKINEVTLFRHFGSKKQLFMALIGQFVEKQKQELSCAIHRDACMEEVLSKFAVAYLESFEKSADFLRTLIGETPRHPQAVKQVMSLIKPFRLQFLDFFKLCQERGEIVKEIDCEMALDLFIGMLFSRVVKPRFDSVDYPSEDYAQGCVRVTLNGLASKRRRK